MCIGPSAFSTHILMLDTLPKPCWWQQKHQNEWSNTNKIFWPIFRRPVLTNSNWIHSTLTFIRIHTFYIDIYNIFFYEEVCLFHYKYEGLILLNKMMHSKWLENFEWMPDIWSTPCWPYNFWQCAGRICHINWINHNQ